MIICCGHRFVTIPEAAKLCSTTGIQIGKWIHAEKIRSLDKQVLIDVINQSAHVRLNKDDLARRTYVSVVSLEELLKIPHDPNRGDEFL